jgi:hypothetical protein
MVKAQVKGQGGKITKVTHDPPKFGISQHKLFLHDIQSAIEEERAHNTKVS